MQPGPIATRRRAALDGVAAGHCEGLLARDNDWGCHLDAFGEVPFAPSHLDLSL